MSDPATIRRAEFARSLAALSDGHPAWVAIKTLLDTDIDLATDGVCDQALEPDKRIWQAGYLAHARDFKRFLEDVRREGLGAPEEVGSVKS